FLGYEITMLQEDTKRTKRDTNGYGTKTMCRSINRHIGLRVPKGVLEAKVERYMKSGKAVHRKELVELSDYEIVTTYQLEFRGIANYYRLAHNLSSLTRLKWVMETSLTKTLASKHKITVPNVYEKYGAKLMVDNKE